jgi:superfamily II DNA or RNA helicase
VRDYQSEIIDDFHRLVADGVRSTPLTAPTGGGKTVIADSIVASAVAAGALVLLGEKSA